MGKPVRVSSPIGLFRHTIRAEREVAAFRGGVCLYTVRFPVSLMVCVDEEAYARGVTRSEELRVIAAESREHRRGVAWERVTTGPLTVSL